MPCYDLSRLSNEELGCLDIAAVNLRCAEGLPDAVTPKVPSLLRMLDRWAKEINEATYAAKRRFKQDRQGYMNSYDVFRIVMMGTYLQKNLGISYDRQLAGLPTDDPSTWKPFNSSRHLFIHGPMLGYGGTCVSLPILFCAVGRRLNYPLKLALANGHVFVRWETGHEFDSFNIEATADGLDVPPSSFYRNWPFKLEPSHLATGCFLRSLTPRDDKADVVEIQIHFDDDFQMLLKNGVLHGERVAVTAGERALLNLGRNGVPNSSARNIFVHPDFQEWWDDHAAP